MVSAVLGSQLENFVSKLVETGSPKSDVLREDIRLIQERGKRGLRPILF